MLKRRDSVDVALKVAGQAQQNDGVLETRQAASAEATAVPISDAEKKFFQQLFPNAAEEIRTYTPYQKNGLQQPMQVGTHIDVRG